MELAWCVGWNSASHQESCLRLHDEGHHPGQRALGDHDCRAETWGANAQEPHKLYRPQPKSVGRNTISGTQQQGRTRYIRVRSTWSDTCPASPFMRSGPPPPSIPDYHMRRAGRAASSGGASPRACYLERTWVSEAMGLARVSSARGLRWNA